ncbi:MAG: hypothetical protein AAF517_21305, partial [Planctomycetota bacterium]
VNGKEVHRYNMPKGDIGFTSTASGTVSSSKEKSFQRATVSTEHFRDGENVIAVELHQAGLTSSDCGFDLKISSFGWVDVK